MPAADAPGAIRNPEPGHAEGRGLTWRSRNSPPGTRPPEGLPLEPEMHPLVQNKHDLVSIGDAIGGVVLADGIRAAGGSASWPASPCCRS